MAHWGGAQGQANMAEITQNTPICDVPPRKAQTRNEKMFFFILTTRLAESVAEIITIRFASWKSGRIVNLQPDMDIQELLSNVNRIRIRISGAVLLMFRGFRLLVKVAHCTIIHSSSSEASFQPSVP